MWLRKRKSAVSERQRQCSNGGGSCLQLSPTGQGTDTSRRELWRTLCTAVQNIRIPYDELCLQELETLRKEHLDAFSQNEYCALLVNLHETSTGQLYDMQLLSAFTKAKNMYLIWMPSAAFSDPLDMDQMGIDALILSSQKALALSCGLSMVVLQESFYRNMVEPKDDICLYLSLKEHARNMERGRLPTHRQSVSLWSFMSDYSIYRGRALSMNSSELQSVLPTFAAGFKGWGYSSQASSSAMP